MSGLFPFFFIARPISPVIASFKTAFQYCIHTVLYFNVTTTLLLSPFSSLLFSHWAGSCTSCPLPSCILHQELGRRRFFLVKPTTYKIEEHEEAQIWDSLDLKWKETLTSNLQSAHSLRQTGSTSYCSKESLKKWGLNSLTCLPNGPCRWTQFHIIPNPILQWTVTRKYRNWKHPILHPFSPPPANSAFPAPHLHTAHTSAPHHAFSQTHQTIMKYQVNWPLQQQTKSSQDSQFDYLTSKKLN